MLPVNKPFKYPLGDELLLILGLMLFSVLCFFIYISYKDTIHRKKVSQIVFSLCKSEETLIEVNYLSRKIILRGQELNNLKKELLTWKEYHPNHDKYNSIGILKIYNSKKELLLKFYIPLKDPKKIIIISKKNLHSYFFIKNILFDFDRNLNKGAQKMIK